MAYYTNRPELSHLMEPEPPVGFSFVRDVRQQYTSLHYMPIFDGWSASSRGPVVGQDLQPAPYYPVALAGEPVPFSRTPLIQYGYSKHKL